MREKKLVADEVVEQLKKGIEHIKEWLPVDQGLVLDEVVGRLDKVREVGFAIIVGRMKMLERSIQADLSKIRKRIEKLEKEKR